MNYICEQAKEFKKRYPMTIGWRLNSHSKVIKKHLSADEAVLYVFAGQKSPFIWDMFSTYLVVLTNKRILVAEKRLLFGYYFISITPEMFNDLSVQSGIIWGKVFIDTIKEQVIINNIDKRALAEIQNKVSEYMLEEKRKVVKVEKDNYNGSMSSSVGG